MGRRRANDRYNIKNECDRCGCDLHRSAASPLPAAHAEDLFLCALADRFVPPALSGVSRAAGVGL